MEPGDIYVQVTATSDVTRRSKSVVVLVPRKVIEEYKSKIGTKKYNDQLIARQLADPLASYVFTHRSTFGSFKLAHSFYPTPLPGIERELPEVTRGDLKAWVL
jgi:hypothetical protein